MKLLSVAIPHHDANACFSDGAAVKYLKFERTRQEKRFSFQRLDEWQEDVRVHLGMAAAEADDAVFSFDPRSLPPALHRCFSPDFFERFSSGRTVAERLHPAVCAHLGVRQSWFISHHYTHAISTWMMEPEPAQIRIVIDGIGDGRPWSVYKHGTLVAAGDIRNGSIGWGIREAGKLLSVAYGHYNDIAGKVMGLQSHGRVDPAYDAFLKRFDMRHIKDLWSVKHWLAHKGSPEVGQHTLLDWVATVHHRMGHVLQDFVGEFAQPEETISYTGGVAQNVVWNSLLRERFPKLIIPPHASDEGLSLGGLAWLRQKHQLPKPDFSAFPYAQADQSTDAPSDQTLDQAATLLAAGKVLAWYQGHGEIGPRALGNRSILMDPRLPDGAARMNRVKQREAYRPFGASVLREHFGQLFDGPADAHMLYACQVRDRRLLPAITHVDNSCRVQLVDASQPVFLRLLQRFHALTGCPALMNTSLNVAGKPIAASQADAWQVFEDTPIDALVVGNELKVKPTA